VRLADLAGCGHQACGAQLEAAALEASEDLAREVPLDGVRLGEDQCLFDGQAVA
jgi:hypothetical protein